MRYLHWILVIGIVMMLTGTTGCRRKIPALEPDPDEQIAKVEPKPEPKKKEPEKKVDPKTPKEKGGLVYSVRNAAQRPEIQNDMAEIGRFYQIDATSGSPPTTWEVFKGSLRTAPKLLAKIEQEKMYVVNLTGKRLRNEDILAYEIEASSPAGHCVVRASGQVETTVPTDQLKKELGIP
jgi:hypothetical protein